MFDWNAYAIMGLPMTGVPEGVTVGIDMFGKITARVGFSLEGQGQYTVVTQLLADYFGVQPEDVRVVIPGHLSAPPHFGPGGSRLGVAITGAVLGAADRLKEKLIKVAAGLMQTDPANMELMDGMVRIKGVPGAEMHIAQVAATMLARSDLLPPDMDPCPEATYVWTAPGRTQADEQGRAKSYLTAANACHVVLVEVDRGDRQGGDPEVLHRRRLRHAPQSGQRGRHDPGRRGARRRRRRCSRSTCTTTTGQLLTSTFMDYLLPTINEVPMTEKAALVTPSPFAPLGAKGTGEGAIHTTPAAVMCAINDALAPLGRASAGNARKPESAVEADAEEEVQSVKGAKRKREFWLSRFTLSLSPSSDQERSTPWPTKTTSWRSPNAT